MEVNTSDSKKTDIKFAWYRLLAFRVGRRAAQGEGWPHQMCQWCGVSSSIDALKGDGLPWNSTGKSCGTYHPRTVSRSVQCG